MYGLSKKQEQVYSFLEDMWLVNGRQPNLAEMADYLGMHYVTLRQHLGALESKGYLRIQSQGRGRSPVIHLTQDVHLEAA